MVPRGNWTWKLALALVAVAAVLVVAWPLPDPPPAPDPSPAMVEDTAPAQEFDEQSMLHYTVQEGDTADSIARLFVVRLDDVLSVNRIPLGGDVEPGQRIWIPPGPGD